MLLQSHFLRASVTDEGESHPHKRFNVRVHVLVARALRRRARPGHVQVAAPLFGHALRQRGQLCCRAAAQALACAKPHCLAETGSTLNSQCLRQGTLHVWDRLILNP